MTDGFPRSEANLSRLDDALPETSRHGPDPDVPETARYLPERLLGTGGMGRVWAARDLRLGRVVALKEIATGDGGSRRNEQVVLEARLAREAWIAARLDHPGILPVHDLGTKDDGSVYYAMPLVRGESLAERIERTPLSERAPLLRCVLEACQAVAAAHREGVVHRDLKPSNIMLVEGGGTRIVDWGLACLMEEPEDARRGVVGTPQFMAPEQRRGDAVDPRSDVWSLGATLQQAVSGTARQHSGDGLARASSELDAIIRRALADAPSARYQDAGAMAEDLGRYLDGRRVEAHEYSAGELVVRLVRAWRWPLGIAAIAAVTVLAIVAIGVARLAQERDRAIAAESVAETALGKSDRDMARSLASQARLSAEHGFRADAEVLAAHSLAWGESPVARGILFGYGATARPRSVRDVMISNCASVDFDPKRDELACRTDDAIELWDLSTPERLWRVEAKSRNLALTEDFVVFTDEQRTLTWLERETGDGTIALSTGCGQSLLARGRRIVNADTDCIWSSDGIDAAAKRIMPCRVSDYIAGVGISEDGEQWAAGCAGGYVVVGTFGDEAHRTYPVPYENPHVVMALAFTGDGNLVLATNRGQVRVLALESGVLGPVVHDAEEQIRAIRMSASGVMLIQSSAGAPSVIDIDTGKILARMRNTPRAGIGWQGDRLLEVDAGRVSTWEIPRRDSANFSMGAGVTAVDFDSRGERVVVSHADGISVRDLRTALPVMDVRGIGVIKGVVFSDHDLIVHSAVSGDGRTHREVNVELGADVTSPLEAMRDPGSRFHDGRRIFRVDKDWLAILAYSCGIRFGPSQMDRNSMSTWTCLPQPGVDHGDMTRSALESHPSRFLDGATNGRDVVMLEANRDVVWWFSPSSMFLERLFEVPGAVALAVSDDIGDIAVAEAGAISLWDGWSGALKMRFSTPGAAHVDVAISKEARWVAAGSVDGALWVWDTSNGALVVRLEAHTDRVSALAFSPDGAKLVSGSWDGRVRVYDTSLLDSPRQGIEKRMEQAWKVELSSILMRAGDPLE